MPEPPRSPLIARGHTRVSPGLRRHLSRGDALRCLEIIHRSLGCEDAPGLSALLGEVGSLIGADHSACLLSSQPPGQEAKIVIVDGTFPAEWLAIYAQRRFHLIDPIVAENFSTFALQYWSDTYRKSPPPKGFTGLAEDFGLRTGFSFGQRNRAGTGGSLFSFSGPNLKRCPRSAVIQDLLLPHLHRVLGQLEPDLPPRGPASPLSARELEVLRWISAGKSSWETGVILRIAERTVNFHVRNIVQKLDAVNRPQAVAMALKLGLLGLP